MVNRSYLPYKSAREYVDRGMAKWMGFFISEHSTALSAKGDDIDLSRAMNEEKIPLLSQVFLGKQNILLFTSLQKEPYSGIIQNMTEERLYLKTKDRLINFLYSQIISVCIDEMPEE